MERLTKKNADGSYSRADNTAWQEYSYNFVIEVIQKLGKLEDESELKDSLVIMISTLKELESRINTKIEEMLEGKNVYAFLLETDRESRLEYQRLITMQNKVSAQIALLDFILNDKKNMDLRRALVEFGMTNLEFTWF